MVLVRPKVEGDVAAGGAAEEGKGGDVEVSEVTNSRDHI